MERILAGMTRMFVLTAAVAFAACAPAEDAASDADAEMPGATAETPGATAETPGATEQQELALGPVDGHDLPPSELDRVQVGDTAPDFTLVSLAGPPVTLSDFRGEKNIVLVFYRGHW